MVRGRIVRLREPADTRRQTSSIVGAATRMRRHLLLMGAMSLLVLLAHKMMRMLDMYFSMVRRSAACASRLSESASLIMTTIHAICTKNLINANSKVCNM